MAAPAEPCRVECYSGHRYAQEPRAFTWRGLRREVASVDRAWRSPEGMAFVVQTAEGRRFQLGYDEREDLWRVSDADPPGAPG